MLLAARGKDTGSALEHHQDTVVADARESGADDGFHLRRVVDSGEISDAEFDRRLNAGATGDRGGHVVARDASGAADAL